MPQRKIPKMWNFIIKILFTFSQSNINPCFRDQTGCHVFKSKLFKHETPVKPFPFLIIYIWIRFYILFGCALCQQNLNIIDFRACLGAVLFAVDKFYLNQVFFLNKLCRFFFLTLQLLCIIMSKHRFRLPTLAFFFSWICLQENKRHFLMSVLFPNSFAFPPRLRTKCESKLVANQEWWPGVWRLVPLWRIQVCSAIFKLFFCTSP